MTRLSPHAPAALSEEEAHEIGVEACIYAHPLVLLELTRRVATNVVKPDARRGHAPMNQFAHGAAYADASNRDVVRPNADTLYSSLWFDVGPEPLVLTLPDTGDRYHVIPIYDMWTDVFATLGTRTNGNGGGNFALVGPNWKGTLPEGVRRIACPTDTGWIIGRIQTNGAGDYANVHALQAGLSATPLSAWGKPYTPPPGRVDPSVDMTSPPTKLEKLTPQEFFGLFAELLKRNPPHAADYPMLLRMERLGIVPGQSFSLADAPEAVQRALARAVPDAYKLMKERGPFLRSGGAGRRQGWNISRGAYGSYGIEYMIRSYVAYRGLGALPAQEATYPALEADAEGRPLTGDSKYVLHFDKDQIPPVRAFWSLTMYGPDLFFVDNPINRYAIGDRDPLAFNADGSLDLYIQKDPPGKDKESNWLPAPAGRFDMTLRLYWPQPQALDGRWMPPALERLP
ncbi:MAG: DUF1254 domain-containing protein [Rubrivivax sp.]